MDLSTRGRVHGPGVRALRLAIVALAALLPVAPAAAEGPLDEGLRAAGRPLDRSSPRAAVEGYLVAARAGDFARAAHYLDLESMSVAERAAIGPLLARRLKIVLDRTFWVNLEALSASPAGDDADGLPAGTDRLTTISSGGGEVDILLERIGRADQPATWVVHPASVAAIDRLYEEHGYGWLGDHLPGIFFTVRLWEVQLWQACALALLLLVGWGVARIVARPLLALLARGARRTGGGWDDELLTVVARPLRIGILAAVLYVGAGGLGLPLPVADGMRVIWKLVAVVLLGWLVSAWVGLGARLLERSVVRDQGSLAGSLIPIFGRVAKIGVWVLVVIVGMETVGVRVMGLIAGVGIGGLAIAFAAQRTIENFFGALAIAADRPFVVGDFVSIGGMLGSVENVGLRSTRLRTPARTVVTIPNGSLLSERVENYTRRDRMLYNPSISVLYETTTAQLELIVDDLKKLLLGHPKVFHDMVRVRFAGFGESALNIEVFTWITTADYYEFTAVSEELNFEILRIVERAGTGFAFPSRTVYTAGEAGMDADRARQAATAVAERRSAGRLWLPEPPGGGDPA